MSEIDFTQDAKANTKFDAYAKGETVTDLLFVQGKTQDKKVHKYKMELEVLGNLCVSDYGHSVLCKLVSGEDVETFEKIEEAAAATIPEKIEFKPFVKDEKFFMKLPHKNDNYRATLDPSFLPSQPEKSPFQNGSTMVVEFTVSIWCNFENSTSGLFLNVLKVTVDGGKKKTVRRR